MGYFSNSFVLDSTYVTQPYHINGEGGYNYNHWGIDLVGWNGSYTCLAWIKAHSDGIVEAVRNDCPGFEGGSYGNYVLIRHDNNYRTLYAHGAPNTVKVWPGQRVKRGDNIMFMGNTGESYGGHLHFEIRRPDGYKINPEPYLAADLPDADKLDVDGIFGPKSLERLQKVLKKDRSYVDVDRMLSGQYTEVLKAFPSFERGIIKIENNGKGDNTFRAIQEVLRSYGLYDGNIDGLGGPKTAGGLIRFLKMFGFALTDKNYFDTEDAKAYQEFLNKIYY